MKIRGLLIGCAIGDALGVPVEFESRMFLQQDPVIDMRGYGTYDVPAGTFSDDTSLSWALADCLLEGYDIKNLANKFLKWKNCNEYTATGLVFDCGITTSKALERFMKCGNTCCGANNESENGNGALMRIAPLILLLKGKKIDERFQLVKEVSSVTHAHIRSILSCFFYCEFLLELCNGSDKYKSYIVAQNKLKHIFKIQNISKQEQNRFEKIYPNNIWTFSESEIYSTGYVLHTLEAAFWCFFTTDNYKDAVLKAVNLGGDTDTTAAVVGAMAGLYYGYGSIPSEWKETLKKRYDLESLSDALQLKYTI